MSFESDKQAVYLQVYRPVYFQLVDVLLHKAQFPSDQEYESWSSDEKEQFRIYRCVCVCFMCLNLSLCIAHAFFYYTLLCASVFVTVEVFQKLPADRMIGQHMMFFFFCNRLSLDWQLRGQNLSGK